MSVISFSFAEFMKVISVIAACVIFWAKNVRDIISGRFLNPFLIYQNLIFHTIPHNQQLASRFHHPVSYYSSYLDNRKLPLVPKNASGSSMNVVFMIVLPVNITFEKWIAELQIDYSSNEVPMYFTEDNWREFADYCRRLNVFNNDEIPLHNVFPDWQSWAMRLVQNLGF